MIKESFVRGGKGIFTQSDILRFRLRYLRSLRQCDKVCLFVGSPRSGTTLVGALLNAHPEIALAHEVKFWKFLSEEGLSYENIQLGRRAALGYLLSHAENSRKSLSQNGYNYRVNLNSNYDSPIKIIGDKSAVWNETNNKTAVENMWLTVDFLRKQWKLKPFFVHIVRNPYDVITTMCIRRMGKETKELSAIKTSEAAKILLNMDKFMVEKFELVLGLFETFNETAQSLYKLQKYPLQIIHLDELAKNPKTVVKSLTDFLGVESTENYLNACAGIVKPINKTRMLLEQMWTPANKDKLKRIIDRYEWLADYTFEN